MRGPMCESCAHLDRGKMADLQDTWKRAGLKPFRHVWCGRTDRPEDPRWESCPAFEAVGRG